ncbi:hypothetical protein PUN28_015905 [Cardiocondyla obscurior]|uniref:Uncharacterized protein n=1 Tax=Cardiocondyla obscurior TaxID=286306 RepID=A0AAW2EQ07_9HYME
MYILLKSNSFQIVNLSFGSYYGKPRGKIHAIHLSHSARCLSFSRKRYVNERRHGTKLCLNSERGRLVPGQIVGLFMGLTLRWFRPSPPHISLH